MNYIFKGTTKIKQFTVTDPMYDSKVRCRLSKRLSSKFSWDVEVHSQYDKDEDSGMIAFYVLRRNTKYEGDPINNRRIDGYTYNNSMKLDKREIGVDSARYNINDIEVYTRCDGDWGDSCTFVNPKQYANLDKGLVGIFCIVYFNSDCSCDYDLFSQSGIQSMLHDLFKTTLSVSDRVSTNIDTKSQTDTQI